MSGSRDCPNCHRAIPPSALRCECGYDFVSRSVGPPRPTAGSGAGSRALGLCCLVLAPVLLVGGVVAAVDTFRAGDDDVALGQLCGAFAAGALTLGVGVYLRRSSPSGS